VWSFIRLHDPQLEALAQQATQSVDTQCPALLGQGSFQRCDAERPHQDKIDGGDTT
jgi:hypothetical protein